MKVYRTFVQAMQYTGDNYAEVKAWIKPAVGLLRGEDGDFWMEEGQFVRPGDFIVKHPDDSLAVYNPADFASAFRTGRDEAARDEAILQLFNEFLTEYRAIREANIDDVTFYGTEQRKEGYEILEAEIAEYKARLQEVLK